MLKRWCAFNRTLENNIHLDELANIIETVVAQRFAIHVPCFYDVTFLSEKQARTLNLTLRHKDYVPDVLSILASETKDDFLLPSKAPFLLGEMYLCLNAIKSHAKTYRVSLLSELSRMYIHGLLHLLDFNHELNSGAEYAVLTVQDQLTSVVCKRYKNQLKRQLTSHLQQSCLKKTK